MDLEAALKAMRGAGYTGQPRRGRLMGHYASEMDPDWGKPTPAELEAKKFAAEHDAEVSALANTLFYGYDSMAGVSDSNRTRACKTAEAIDALIARRVSEASHGV